jgi:solute:Na+ symporter, SSS family
MLLLAETLRSWDWAVLALYAAVIIGAGVWAQVRTKQSTATDYFLAGRHIPVWAVAVSTLATAQSAATFVGVPQDSYDGGLTYLSANIGGLLAAFILARLFIPVYYRLGVATPYQLLQTRFGPAARHATSWAYLVGRVFASGSRVYVGAIPVSIAFFGDRDPAHLTVVIAIFMAFSILYTLWGGLDSVIWTDIVQVGVYLGAAVVAIVLLLRHIPADVPTILDALRHGGPGGTSKLTVISTGIDSSKPLWIDFKAPFTIITAVTGWTLLNLAAFGTDQDLVQRLLTCKSAVQGSRSVILSMVLGIPVVLVFAVVGLLLWVVYNRPDLMGAPTPGYIAGDTADIFLKYTLHELPVGAAGLVIAGVLAAGPAGVNASLNSMAGTLVNDFYRTVVASDRPERHYVAAGRVAVVLWGVILAALAVLCIYWQRHSGENILSFVLGVMTFAYAGLLGVFLTALLTRRGSAASAIAALVTGFLVVLTLQPVVWGWLTSHSDWSRQHLASFGLAAPWRLVVGTILATAVCLIAGPRPAKP